MRCEAIAVSGRQLGLLAVLLAAPLLLVVAIDAVGDSGQPARAIAMAQGVCLALAGLAVAALLGRHRVQLDGDELVVKHSFYTFRLHRSEAGAAELIELTGADALRVTLKRNGIACCGLLSGWFYGPHNEDLFCAVSAAPVYKLRFARRELALSCSRAMAEAIRAWGVSADRS